MARHPADRAAAPARRDERTEVLDALRRIIRTLRISAGRAERETGVSSAQLFVLQQLAEAPAHSLNELAERTHTHQSSVSVVVSRLVKRRLVMREQSRTDARRVVLAVTPAGRALAKRAPEPAQARLIDALARLSRSEVHALAGGLRRLVEEMGAANEPATMLFEPDRTRRARPTRPRATEGV